VSPSAIATAKILAERGLEVSLQAVRQWVQNLDDSSPVNFVVVAIAQHPNDISTRRPKRLRACVSGAADDEGTVPLFAQRWRDKAAAVKQMRRLLKWYGFVPAV
jgi:putative transposase